MMNMYSCFIQIAVERGIAAVKRQIEIHLIRIGSFSQGVDYQLHSFQVTFVSISE